MVAKKSRISKKLLAAGVAGLLALMVMLSGGQSASEQASLNTGSVLVVADGGGNASPPGSG